MSYVNYVSLYELFKLYELCYANNMNYVNNMSYVCRLYDLYGLCSIFMNHLKSKRFFSFYKRINLRHQKSKN